MTRAGVDDARERGDDAARPLGDHAPDSVLAQVFGCASIGVTQSLASMLVRRRTGGMPPRGTGCEPPAIPVTVIRDAALAAP